MKEKDNPIEFEAFQSLNFLRDCLFLYFLISRCKKRWHFMIFLPIAYQFYTIRIYIHYIFDGDSLRVSDVQIGKIQMRDSILRVRETLRGHSYLPFA